MTILVFVIIVMSSMFVLHLDESQLIAGKSSLTKQLISVLALCYHIHRKLHRSAVTRLACDTENQMKYNRRNNKKSEQKIIPNSH